MPEQVTVRAPLSHALRPQESPDGNHVYPTSKTPRVPVHARKNVRIRMDSFKRRDMRGLVAQARRRNEIGPLRGNRSFDHRATVLWSCAAHSGKADKARDHESRAHGGFFSLALRFPAPIT